MIKVPINNSLVLRDLCVELARANGIVLKHVAVAHTGKALCDNLKGVKRPPRTSQGWYQGLMLNYLQNNGKVVLPVKRFYTTGARKKVPVVEVPEQLWRATLGNRAKWAKKANPRKDKSFYSREAAQSLYNSDEWRRLRYAVLRKQNGRCQLCGKSRRDGAVLHVDHIVPLSVDWSKRLDINNLQVLCSDCNLGKSNTDTIDWR